MRESLWWLGVAALWVLDRITKWWVVAHIAPHEVVSVLPGVQLIHQSNRGLAMGWFHGASTSVQTLLYLGVAALVCWVAWHFVQARHEPFKHRLPWALLLGGALGNLWDRLLHGAVVDFIDVFWNHWHYYTFNVADIAISVGVVLLLWHSCFEPEGSVNT